MISRAKNTRAIARIAALIGVGAITIATVNGAAAHGMSSHGGMSSSAMSAFGMHSASMSSAGMNNAGANNKSSIAPGGAFAGPPIRNTIHPMIANQPARPQGARASQGMTLGERHGARHERSLSQRIATDNAASSKSPRQTSGMTAQSANLSVNAHDGSDKRAATRDGATTASTSSASTATASTPAKSPETPTSTAHTLSDSSNKAAAEVTPATSSTPQKMASKKQESNGCDAANAASRPVGCRAGTPEERPQEIAAKAVWAGTKYVVLHTPGAAVAVGHGIGVAAHATVNATTTAAGSVADAASSVAHATNVAAHKVAAAAVWFYHGNVGSFRDWGHGFSAVGSKIGSGVSTAAHAVGSTVSSAAKSVKNFIGGLF